MTKNSSTLLRSVTALAAIAVIIFIVLGEGSGYTPHQRVLLFFLAGSVPAVLFAAEAAARFELHLRGFAFAAGGGAALMFGALFMLNLLARPDYVTTISMVLDENHIPVEGLARDNAVEVRAIGGSGGHVEHFVAGNALIIRFPEQTPRARVRLRLSMHEPAYVGELSYLRPQDELVLGRDLLALTTP